MPLVDVVVVSYNSRDRLRACVEPLCGVDWIAPIVVDNASPDGSLEAVADLPVHAVQSGRNGGFAFGCNTGLRAGGSPYVLFLNPDARMEPADLERLIQVVRADERVGVAGPRIVDADGGVDPSRRRFPSVVNSFARALLLHRLVLRDRWTDELMPPAGYDRPGNVDWLSGACLLSRRDVLEGLGGMDEGFFLYYEDTDLCRRIRSLGLEVRYDPSATCMHEGGASAPRPSLFGIMAASRVRWSRLHMARPLAALDRVAVALEALVRLVVARGGLKARSGHLAALRAAIRAPRGPVAHWPPDDVPSAASRT